ncbi:MAG TPA: sulfotransferase domain-containing protein [Cryomorphaceae bacterium]|nr:sulfotransferase domain-containing protein [Cryomorphaceae bacterium]HKL39406.1 sulfotransferase domain-containing protein [Cryomorphaceae bacterium]
MNRTLLHIGMPRTASTFFQHEVFPNVEGFTNLGVNQTQYSEAFQRLLYQDESRYDESAIGESLKKETAGSLIVSNELFVGQSLYMVSTNRTRNAKRLKRLFPNGEIILFLRNQADLLESLYSIGVYSGHTAKPEEFIQFDDEASAPANPLFPTFSAVEQTEQYFYTSLLRIYQEQFEKVHVFLYEDFTSNPIDFIERFCEKLDLNLTVEIDFGKRKNSSLSARQLEYLRRTNSLKEIFERSGTGKKIFRKNVQAIEHRISGKSKFHFAPLLRKKIKDHFLEDNSILTEMVSGLKDSESFGKHYTTKI